ncbi:MAG: DMT family transporter [Eubacteriales bacterium]
MTNKKLQHCYEKGITINMIKNAKAADIALMITAIIWGTGFIATEYAIDTGAQASLIITMRFLIAGITLGIVYFKSIIKMERNTIIVGCIAGAMLFGGFYLQTLGQSMTTVSNSSFLTSTNVVMVPFIVWFFTKEHPKTKYFVLGGTALIGIGILTLDFSKTMVFNVGDIFVIFAAICFALHIAYLGIYGKGKDTKHLTFLQMITAGIFALIYMVIFDSSAINFEIIKAALPSTAYLAIFSSCVCYYLQTTGQQYAAPSKTAIILCTEGLFGSIFAVALGIDALTANIVIGGIVIISSVMLAEVDLSVFNKKKNSD